jgi:hypothetical protein
MQQPAGIAGGQGAVFMPQYGVLWGLVCNPTRGLYLIRQ